MANCRVYIRPIFRSLYVRALNITTALIGISRSCDVMTNCLKRSQEIVENRNLFDKRKQFLFENRAKHEQKILSFKEIIETTKLQKSVIRSERDLAEQLSIAKTR